MSNPPQDRPERRSDDGRGYEPRSRGARQLSDVMLHNSVNVMMKKRDEGVTEYPLFTHREVDLAVKRWRTVPLHTRFDVTGERLPPSEDAELSFEFFDAGHILGSVGTLIRAHGRKIFYTGDVQFDDQTIMQGARFPEEELDVLIIETTRGDRRHAGRFHARRARNCGSPRRSRPPLTAAPACSSRSSPSARRRKSSRCSTNSGATVCSASARFTSAASARS